ncbi:MAG: hypothetical protein AMS27_06875 [Bacteroides sp. SM23_62_1]|nr:MAG: hypothetical protein AMS27_06875 [Bacteroides sp. SM23_62_1]
MVFTGVSGFHACKGSDKKELKHWDVIIVGGGPGGVPAAVAAARNGIKVLLIERYGFLGGMATAALVHPYMTYKAGDQIIIRGLFKEFLDKLQEGNAILDDRAHFDAEPMKWILDRFVLDAGVDLILHSSAIGVLKDKNEIKAVRIFYKEGTEDLSADVFIDATGDGDIAAWAGAQIEIGRESDGACQPMTASFRMANVKVEDIPANEEIFRLYDEAKVKGEIDNPREDVLYFRSVHPDVIHFNTTRIIGKSSLDSWQMTDAEIEGRRQVDEMVKFLKKYIKGFENSYLMKMGTQIGVRESRRVIGKYILTADDVLEARHFDDGIACASYNIDIHNPAGTGTELKSLKPGTYYQIPYRCLVPNNVDNLIIASRCISADHAAHSSLRVQPIVWAVGQAGGTAAALCIKNKIKPEEVDAEELRNLLLEQGAFL